MLVRQEESPLVRWQVPVQHKLVVVAHLKDQVLSHEVGPKPPPRLKLLLEILLLLCQELPYL